MTSRHFGAISGVPPGTWFPDRATLAAAGVHRPLQAGISGSATEGADSIVLSGGYEDDLDLGDEIVYTGHGGNDPSTGRQVADQTLTRQNLALAKNCTTGLPVRVIRGARHPFPDSPPTGYRYDGLYRVDALWSERGKSGFLIWQFRLERQSDPVPSIAVVGEPDPGPAPRQHIIVQRVIRSSGISQRIKEIHDHRCQVCGIRLETVVGPYSEAAHIRPLGQPHNGPDVPDNVLCLCPNHHALFDLGAIVITADFQVVDVLLDREIGELHRHPAHLIDPAALAYHRALFLENEK